MFNIVLSYIIILSSFARIRGPLLGGYDYTCMIRVIRGESSWSLEILVCVWHYRLSGHSTHMTRAWGTLRLLFYFDLVTLHGCESFSFGFHFFHTYSHRTFYLLFTSFVFLLNLFSLWSIVVVSTESAPVGSSLTGSHRIREPHLACMYGVQLSWVCALVIFQATRTNRQNSTLLLKVSVFNSWRHKGLVQLIYNLSYIISVLSASSTHYRLEECALVGRLCLGLIKFWSPGSSLMWFVIVHSSQSLTLVDKLV